MWTGGGREERGRLRCTWFGRGKEDRGLTMVVVVETVGKGEMKAMLGIRGE